jgi:hypothetical protein
MQDSHLVWSYLAHKKLPRPRTLRATTPRALWGVLRESAFFYGRGTPVERLQSFADFNERHCQNLYQNRLDGPIMGHVLVHNSQLQGLFSMKSAKVSRNRSFGGDQTSYQTPNTRN